MTPKLIKGPVAMRREAKEKREMAIYREMMAAAAAGSLMADICDAMMRKHGVSRSTLYAIRRRVEKRISNPKQKEAV